MKSLQRLLRWWWIFAVAAIVIAITYIYIGIKGNSPIHLEVERNTRIDLTPEQILSVRDIGQWEFLTINTEELVEWQRSRTLTTDRLTRIYQGTLRLGIDMSKASDDWFTSLPDSTAQCSNEDALSPLAGQQCGVRRQGECRHRPRKG